MPSIISTFSFLLRGGASLEGLSLLVFMPILYYRPALFAFRSILYSQFTYSSICVHISILYTPWSHTFRRLGPAYGELASTVSTLQRVSGPCVTLTGCLGTRLQHHSESLDRSQPNYRRGLVIRTTLSP